MKRQKKKRGWHGLTARCSDLIGEKHECRPLRETDCTPGCPRPGRGVLQLAVHKEGPDHADQHQQEISPPIIGLHGRDAEHRKEDVDEQDQHPMQPRPTGEQHVQVQILADQGKGG